MMDVGQCESMLRLYKQEMEEACRPDFVPELPTAIPQATADEADNLKEISGVGPYLEGKLNAFGIYTFQQVAALDPDVIEQLGETFGSLRGPSMLKGTVRATRLCFFTFGFTVRS